MEKRGWIPLEMQRTKNVSRARSEMKRMWLRHGWKWKNVAEFRLKCKGQRTCLGHDRKWKECGYGTAGNGKSGWIPLGMQRTKDLSKARLEMKRMWPRYGWKWKNVADFCWKCKGQRTCLGHDWKWKERGRGTAENGKKWVEDGWECKEQRTWLGQDWKC